MGMASSTHRIEDERIQEFGRKARRKGTTKNIQAEIENNIKMDLTEIRWGGIDWGDFARTNVICVRNI